MRFTNAPSVKAVGEDKISRLDSRRRERVAIGNMLHCRTYAKSGELWGVQLNAPTETKPGLIAEHSTKS
jgi:hypothetical protein